MRLIPLHNEQQVARWAARHIVDSINRFFANQRTSFCSWLTDRRYTARHLQRINQTLSTR